MPRAASAAKTDPRAELEAIYSKITSKMTMTAVHRGSEVEDVYRVPFESPNLLYATEGGIPIGRFSQFWGGLSSFKTRAAYECIRAAQTLPVAAERVLMPRIKDLKERNLPLRAKRLQQELEYLRETWPNGMECAFYNAEQQYDPEYAKKLGIDTDRLNLVESQVIEDIVGIIEATAHLVEMHVIDSTSSAASVEEHAMEMTDRRRGLDARVWKQTLRKAMAHWSPQRNVGILINQVSTNQTHGGDQPVSTKFIGHTSSMTMKFQRAKFLYRVDGVLKEDKPKGADEQSLAGRVEPAGVQIYASIEKSRVCRPFRIAALQADFVTRSYDHSWELANAAEFFGMVEKSGTWYKVPHVEKAIQGEKGLTKYIREDQEFAERIYARLMYSLEEED